jgi:hypothetical protein
MTRRLPRKIDVVIQNTGKYCEEALSKELSLSLVLSLLVLREEHHRASRKREG